jgi:hypothetical protein
MSIKEGIHIPSTAIAEKLRVKRRLISAKVFFIAYF